MRVITPHGAIEEAGGSWDPFLRDEKHVLPEGLDEEISRLVVPDTASGTGHHLFLPRGAVIFNALKEYIRGIYADIGCFELESPMVMDYSHPAVQDHALHSGERTYHMREGDERLMTKIGALYSQLDLVARNGLPEAAMPLKLFEMTRCCRIEDDPSPLRRPREFTMVDMHELCHDLHEAMDEGRGIHRRIQGLADDFGWHMRSTYTVTDAFLHDHAAYLGTLASMVGDEGLLLAADPAKGRPLNLEYHLDIGEGSPLEISALQIDEHNPGMFGIRNADGTEPVLIHANIVGSIERLMYAVVNDAVHTGRYRAWLAPEQIRLIPSCERDVERCMWYASALKGRALRVTVDDREGYTDAMKDIDAKAHKVPYVITLGKDMIDMEGLVDMIDDDMQGKPRMGATYPTRLSRWPGYL